MESNITIIEGKLPILISAPHVFPQPRKTLDGIKLKVGEQFTSDIMRDICERTNCFGIMLNSEADYDPNFDKYSDNEYKQAVKKMKKDFDLQYFIDLHGLKDSYQFDVGIFIKKKYENSKKLAYKIADDLNRADFNGALITIHNFHSTNTQETLSEYVCTKLNIPAVQIEIARYIRDEEDLRIAFGKVLSESIISLS
jgi:hypothetical protein